MKRAALLVVMSLFALSASVRAENLFIGPGGGDLTDPANWSEGVVPTDQGIIRQPGPVNLTLGEDLTGPVLFVEQADVSLDLNGKTWTSGAIVPIAGGSTSTFQIFNGTLGGQSFFNSIPQNNISDLKVTLTNLQTVDTGRFGASLWATSKASLVLDNAREVRLSSAFAKDEVAVHVTNNSVLKGGPSIAGRIVSDGPNGIASLIVEDGATLSGAFIVEGTNSAEIILRDGAQTAESTKLFASSLRRSVIDISDPSTEITVKSLYSGYGGSILFVYSSDFVITVRNGATVNANLDFSSLPLINEDRQFINGTNLLTVTDPGTSLHITTNSFVNFWTRVTNGGLFKSDFETITLGTILVQDAHAVSTFTNILGIAASEVLSGRPPKVTIERGSITGDISGYRDLILNDGLLDGDANIAAVIGDGHITGDVTSSLPSGNAIDFTPQGLIEVDGDVAEIQVLETFLRGTSIGEFGQVIIRGGLADFPIPSSLFEAIDGKGPITQLVVNVDSHFRGSVGDRLELLKVLETSIGIDHLLDGFSPENQETLIWLYLNQPTVTSLPTGYAFDFFVTDHAIGIEITAVPEVSSSLFVGLGLLAAMSLKRWRKRQN